jgi:dihydrofolate synthase / folylpolyglutamate synthase
MIDSYQTALDYLYTFANFEHTRIEQYTPDKIDPTRPARLLALLANPQQQYPTVHIAGTKGKGSVAAMTAACLRAAGLKTGLYTSPHLLEFRERFRVLTTADADGRISEVEFVTIVNELKEVVDQVPGLTWFELVTAVGFRYFARQRVDVAVIEVGLGGRLDATNVITPLVAVITSLSLDHTDLLGNTLADIAYEKGGIIKPGVPVVTAPQPAEALARLQAIAQERGSPLVLVGRDVTWQLVSSSPAEQIMVVKRKQVIGNGQPSTESEDEGWVRISVPLAGAHQQENAAVAVAALAQVQAQLPALTDAAVVAGMAAVTWPGRLQMLHSGSAQTPALVLDSAHNPHSAKVLADALPAVYRYQRLWLVLGITADKNISGILQQLLPVADHTFVTRSTHPRAAEPEVLARLVRELGYTAEAYPNVAEAVTAVWQVAEPGDLICVTGSIFVVGDLLNQWDSLQSVVGNL